MRGAASLWRDQGGSAAAEMALILPLTLALIFATFDGAYYMICEHRVVKGVRDAARYAARLDLSNYACPAGAFSGTGNGSATSIKYLARTGYLPPPYGPLNQLPTVPGWGTDPNDVTITVTCLSGQDGIYAVTNNYAPRVSVSTRFAYPSFMASMGFTSATIYIGAAAQSPVIGL